MDSCDVLIVGGGPAGSTCAWALRHAGLDAVVMDAAAFPRDKVCAGWITPQVVTELSIDVDEYRRGRTFQPITAFRTGLINRTRTVDTLYSRPVSFGIRRCEFDHYLLERSKARVMSRAPLATIRRQDGEWIVNETIKAPMLVGAGGHFCPVARWLNDRLAADDAPLVVAQEAEFPLADDSGAIYATSPERPELYFCRDLKGYGWCFRKEGYLNVGLGRLDRRSLPRASAEFVEFLKANRRIPAGASWRWRGHAYLLQRSPRRIVDRGILLIGDSAGLAYAESGEGIRPAVESGLLAASAILDADRCYTREHLEEYANRLRDRFGTAGAGWTASLGGFGQRIASALARPLLEVPWFVRRIVIERWFLHAEQPPVVLSRRLQLHAS
jgi:flavin-dependent dehydrogenase